MASPNSGGFDQDFLERPAKLKKYECPLCLLVTREPNLTDCCGHHFCQSCINQILTARKPCPLCKERSFDTMLDKKQKRKVLELKVSCSMKGRGCRWTGELSKAAVHTNVRNGNCRFVDVTCPNSCGESHQRRQLDKHISTTCRKRPFACEYCRLKATYELVCQHYDQCERFPLNCPNQCEITSVERRRMSDHLSECPLQLVECEYAHAGCKEKIQRRNLAMHVEQNQQKHLLLVFTASQERITALEQKLDTFQKERRAQLEENDQQIAALEEKIREARQQVVDAQRENKRQLKKKDRQIEVLRKALVKVPPVEFTMNDYSLHKGAHEIVDGPIFYTSSWGAKVLVRCYSGYGSVDVELYQLPGEIDDDVKWPVKCKVTVYLLNQLRDRHHIAGSKTVTLARPMEMQYTREENDPLSVRYTTIEDRSKQGIQYLRDNCLKFKICVEIV